MYIYQVPGIYIAAVRTAAAVVYTRQVPRSYCCTKRVTPLESSHGHHLPALAASARAARGGCFDPKRAAKTPGFRACSASREHRVGSLNSRVGSSSGSQQQQYEELVDNSGRWLTHPPLRTPPMPHQEFLAEGRASVGLYTTASVCVRSS